MPGFSLPGCLNVRTLVTWNENLIATCIIALGYYYISRSSEGKMSCNMFQIDYVYIIYSVLKWSTVMSLDQWKLLMFTLWEATVALVHWTIVNLKIRSSQVVNHYAPSLM